MGLECGDDVLDAVIDGVVDGVVWPSRVTIETLLLILQQDGEGSRVRFKGESIKRSMREPPWRNRCWN